MRYCEMDEHNGRRVRAKGFVRLAQLSVDGKPLVWHRLALCGKHICDPYPGVPTPKSFLNRIRKVST
jgi:hypothetical protein